MTTLSERILGLKKPEDGGYQAPVWNAALDAAAAIVAKCPHNRIDHNLECLDCDEPVWSEE